MKINSPPAFRLDPHTDKRTKISEEQTQWARDAIEKGATLTWCAAQLKIHASSLSRILARGKK